MPLNATLVTFAPATRIRSADVNTNFANLNNSTGFNGGVPTLNTSSGNVKSDGNGNLTVVGAQLGKSANGDIMDWSGGGAAIIKANTGGAIIFQIGNVQQESSGSSIPVQVAKIASGGITMLSGGLVLAVGSISRTSTFTGSATGTFNHNLGVSPNICFPVENTGNSADFGFDSPTNLTVHITMFTGTAFNCYCMAY
jgi:hypothetical protein